MKSALCRFVRRSGKFVLAGLMVALLLATATQNAQAQQDMAFGLGNGYTGAAPSNYRTVNYDLTNRVVLYDLPATGPYAAVLGTADGHLDLFARIQGGTTRQVAVYGVINTIGGGTGARFMVGAIDPQDPNPPNNLPNVKSPTRTQNAGLSAVIGELDVDGQPAGGLSIGIGGIAPPPADDVPVNPNDGLIAIPIDIDPNLTDAVTMIAERTLTFSLDNDFSGFANTNLQLLTNSASFPHQGATLQIRRSRPGDMNGNGQVNSFDIPGFVSAVSSVTAYQNANPWLRVQYISDFNGNGQVNSFDIPGLVAAITAGSPEASGSPSAVPEPGACMLALGALAALGIWRRRASQR